MNLMEKYKEAPYSYIVYSNGGFGKTVSLQYMAKELIGSKVEGRIVIPMYIRLSDINLDSSLLNGNFLLTYIRRYFNNTVTGKAVIQMIGEWKDYDFLFLLDGYNEIINYQLPNAQNVLDMVENCLIDLYKFENVHFVITSRKSENILKSEKLEATFDYLELDRTQPDQIKQYLNIQDFDSISEQIKGIIDIPFTLRMFRYIYDRNKEEAVSLTSKGELISTYYEEFEIKKNPYKIDNLAEIRSFIIDTVLPLAGFHIQKALMDVSGNWFEKLDYDVFLDKILGIAEIPYLMNAANIKKVLGMMNILNDDLTFCHQIVGEYFACRGLVIIDGYTDSDADVTGFLRLLSESMEYYYKRGLELIRRTRYLDLADFIYSKYPETSYLVSHLEDCCIGYAKAAKLAFVYYMNLAGLYDDLGNNRLAGEIGWKAVGLIEEIKATDLEMAKYYNFLYYSVNKHIVRDPFILLEAANEYIGRVKAKSIKYHELKAKIISNYGSYYYSIFKKDYPEAYKYHKQALEYRKLHGLSCEASYRTIMSDFYKMKKFSEAYGMYKEAVNNCIGVSGLQYSERKDSTRAKLQVPVDTIVAAMGSELNLLKADGDNDKVLLREITGELMSQIPYVFDKAMESTRKDRNTLDKLKEKLNGLAKVETLEDTLRECVVYYLKQCNAFF